MRRHRAGMSLMETLVSIAILVMLGTVCGAFLVQTVRLSEALEDRDGSSRSSRVAMTVLHRELQLAFLTQNLSAVENYRTVFVGRDDSPDTLFFATRSHQRLYRNTRESDQTEITVWAEPMPDDTPGYMLLHREAPRIDGEPDEGGRPNPLAYNVKAFELRYLDPTTNEWREEWDTEGADTPNRLPRAVEIALTLYAPDPKDPGEWEELAQRTTVQLMYADRLQPQQPDSTFN